MTLEGVVTGGMTQDEMRALSLRLELRSGCDSIATIERIYSRTYRGAYECAIPGCNVARVQASMLWLHLHFGPHGYSFGVATPEEAEALLDAEEEPETPA